MSKNNSREENEEFINPKTVKDLLKEKPKDLIVDIFREFGVPGVATYIGGALMLYFFPKQADFHKQIMYMVSGLALLTLATFISYFRIKAQREREGALIEMAQNSCNRLAEQLGKGLTKEQTEFITQKIRQIQRDITTSIFSRTIEK